LIAAIVSLAVSMAGVAAGMLWLATRALRISAQLAECIEARSRAELDAAMFYGRAQAAEVGLNESRTRCRGLVASYRADIEALEALVQRNDPTGRVALDSIRRMLSRADTADDAVVDLDPTLPGPGTPGTGPV
jgi:hypothetical protein